MTPTDNPEAKVTIRKLEYSDDFEIAEDGFAEIVCQNCDFCGWVDISLTETAIQGSCSGCDLDFEDKLR